MGLPRARFKRRYLLVVVAAVASVGLAAAIAAAAGNKSTPSVPSSTTVPGYQYVQDTFTVSPNTQGINLAVLCPEGRPVTGGGELSASGSVDADVNSSFPIDDGRDANATPDDGWRVDFNNGTGASSSVTVFAVCRIPSP